MFQYKEGVNLVAKFKEGLISPAVSARQLSDKQFTRTTRT